MDARTERIRGDLAAAEDAKTEAVGVLDKYRADLADAKAEAGRIIEEARQAADALKRDQEARLQTELAELRSKAAADVEAAKVQAIADLRGEVAQLAIGAAEVVVGHNLDQATQVQLDRGLHQPGGQPAMSTGEDRTLAYATALFGVARSEGSLAEVEDELFRFARVLEGNDELRTTLTDAALPVSRRQQIIEDLLGGQANPLTTALLSMVVGRRSLTRPAVDHRRARAHERGRGRQGPGRGPLRRGAHRRPEGPPGRRPSAQATGKAVELKVVIDPHRARRPRRPDRRHRDRRLREDPPRPAEDRVLTLTT